MPRPRRPDRERTGHGLSEGMWKFICGEWTYRDAHDAGAPDAFDMFLLSNPGNPQARALWERYREEVVPHVAELTPGRRPPLWWHFDAPEPRRWIGGRTIKKWLPFTKGSPRGEGVEIEEDDPADPPVQESQAAFLKRHSLLLAGEARRLRQRDFAPEVCE